MSCEVKTTSDFLTGTSLTVRIPEEVLDRKALYTIHADKPGSILPFRHRCVDGKVEFVYQISTQNKLQYLSGSRTPIEYAELWSSLLSPLLDCGDWFMKPYSFLLNAEYLYYDRSNKTVCFLYIPSLVNCSDYSDLTEMAAEVTKLISVSDAVLENKVLRAIMKNFDPKDFLQMLRSYIATNTPTAPLWPVPEPLESSTVYGGGGQFAPLSSNMPTSVGQDEYISPLSAPPGEDRTRTTTSPNNSRESPQDASGDININISSDKAPRKTKKTKGKESSGIRKEKEPGKSVGLHGMFGKKKEAQQESVKEARETVSKNSATAERAIPGASARSGSNTESHPATSFSSPPTDLFDLTQCTSIENEVAILRYVGRLQLPPLIEVQIKEGEVFSIGRYDAAAGKKQSSFEFDKKTKAVSRRHAVVERDADGYKIIDLSSSAGTFINSQRLAPNTPCILEKDCRISFGNSGADYIWEEWS